MPEIHFRKHPRAKWHNYDDGIYFVTVCVKEKEHLLGKIVDDEIVLSEAGIITHKCISALENHYGDAILLNHVIMPNHFHIMLEINGRHPAGLRHAAALQEGCITPAEHFEGEFVSHHNARLSIIIGGIKSNATRLAHKASIDLQWQKGFHDHIVRSEQSYKMIMDYIDSNPSRWANDVFFK